jgi:hypothetical protein
MTKMKIMAALLSMSLGVTSFAAVPFTASAETDPTLAASYPHEEITASQKKQMLEKYIKDNSLDAALYTLAVDNGVFTYITYYENDTETAEKIKTFMKENDISENSIIPKLRKGEKPVGGMITDYETIIGKLNDCISENDLPAYVIVWFGNKSYNYTAKQVLKIPFDEVQQVMVMYLWRDEIVPKTIDAMLEKENIDPSLVLYDVMANASPTDTKTQVKGDANCDGGMNMADAVLIMQSIANPEKFGINGNDDNHITEQGMKNADITGDNDGVTNADALEIQKLLLNIS